MRRARCDCACGAAIQRDSRQRRGVTDRGTRNKQLLEGRARLKRELAEVLLVGGDFTPAEDLEVLACRDALDASLLLGPSFVIQGKEDHARRVLPHRRQVEVHDSAKEGIRHLREDAGAVASTGIRPDCTPVLKVAKGGQSEVDDVVTGLPTKGRDHGQATRVPFEVRVVHPLLGGEAGFAGGDATGARCHCYRPHVDAQDGTTSARLCVVYAVIGVLLR